MSASSKIIPEIAPEIAIDATVTSKGQITIPIEIRKRLMAKAGDRLTFKASSEGVTIARKSEENVFEKYRGTWGDILPDGYEGREGIIRYVREMRGHDEYDDLVFGKD
jgi:antitoxin PrlF